MDKKKLRQYRALQREQALNDKAIDKLYDRAADVPTVLGKVVGSAHDFPYTEVRTTVQMDEPKESDEIGRRLRIREARQEQIRAAVLEIEEFIADIPDSDTRQIFEQVYLDGKKMSEIDGFTKSGVSKKISRYLKVSTNSTK